MTYTTATTIRSTITIFTSAVIPSYVMDNYLTEADNYINEELGTSFTTTPPIISDIAKRYVLFLCLTDQFATHNPNASEMAGAQRAIADSNLSRIKQKGYVLDASGDAVSIFAKSEKPRITGQSDSYNFAFSTDGQDDEEAGEDGYLFNEDEDYI